jgi:hypothetical protein|tara:strand:+ start:731 stop:1042 length:312 start_codon:yes stop_codon:yes gene_type:complete
MKISTVFFTVCIVLCAPSFSSFALNQIDFEELSNQLTEDSKAAIKKDMAENLHRVSVEQRSTLSEQAKNIVKEQFDSLLSSHAHDLSGKHAQGEVITNDSECD